LAENYPATEWDNWKVEGDVWVNTKTQEREDYLGLDRLLNRGRHTAFLDFRKNEQVEVRYAVLRVCQRTG